MSLVYQSCEDWQRAAAHVREYIRVGDPDGDGEQRLAFILQCKAATDEAWMKTGAPASIKEKRTANLGRAASAIAAAAR